MNAEVCPVEQRYAPGVSPSNFVGVMMAYLKKSGCDYVWANTGFHNAFFNLKRSLVQHPEYLFLMQEIGFFYVAPNHFSEDLESALTELQMARIIAYVNPEFQKIEITLPQGGIQDFIDSQIDGILSKRKDFKKEDISHTCEALARHLTEIGTSARS